MEVQFSRGSLSHSVASNLPPSVTYFLSSCILVFTIHIGFMREFVIKAEKETRTPEVQLNPGQCIAMANMNFTHCVV